MTKDFFKLLVVSVLSTLLCSCMPNRPRNPNDPFECYNRAAFAFNRTVDIAIANPVAKLYNASLPTPIKKGINNAFINVGTLPTIANELLQFKIGPAIADFWRFGINSTLGIGGLFDVASKFGFHKHYQDLGLTFNFYHIKTPYFVIPIIGPSTITDAIGLYADYELFMVYPHINPWQLRWGILGLDYIRIHANLLPTDKLINDAFDPYVFVRDAYLQYRDHLAHPDATEEIDQPLFESEKPL